MSHQDEDHIVKNARMLKGLFDQLFDSARDLRRHGNASCDGKWLAAIAVTCWGWTQIGTLSDRLDLACKVVGLAIGGEKTITRQGLMSSLKSIGEELIELITNNFFEHLDALGDSKTRYGRRTFAVDGTKFAAPRTIANEAEFSANAKRPRHKKKYSNASNAAKASTVQILTTVIWHIHSGLPLCWRANPGHGSERLDAESMLSRLPARSRLLSDAEFVGYRLWSAIISSGHTFLFRIGANVTLLRSLGKVKVRDGCIYYWPEKAMWKRKPPIVLRLIKLHSGHKVIHLLTNELELTDEHARRLYKERRGIEVYFRTIKQSCSRNKLSCCSPANVMTEINWTLLGIWSALYAGSNLVRDRGQRQLLSPVKVMRVFYQVIATMPYVASDNQTIKELLQGALRLDESSRTSSKKGRRYPCKRPRPPCGKPRLKSPNAIQKKRFAAMYA